MKKRTPRHIVIKLLRISDKDNILQGGREKGWTAYRTREKAYKWQGRNFFNVLKGEKWQPTFICTMEISFFYFF